MPFHLQKHSHSLANSFATPNLHLNFASEFSGRVRIRIRIRNRIAVTAVRCSLLTWESSGLLQRSVGPFRPKVEKKSEEEFLGLLGPRGPKNTAPSSIRPIHPPTSGNTLLGVGGCYPGVSKGVPAVRNFRIYPHPPRLKLPSGQKWGEAGGGVYDFSLEKSPKRSRKRAPTGQCFGNPNPYNLSKKYGSTPPIRTAVRPPFVSPYFPGF